MDCALISAPVCSASPASLPEHYDCLPTWAPWAPRLCPPWDCGFAQPGAATEWHPRSLVGTARRSGRRLLGHRAVRRHRRLHRTHPLGLGVSRHPSYSAPSPRTFAFPQDLLNKPVPFNIRAGSSFAMAPSFIVGSRWFDQGIGFLGGHFVFIAHHSSGGGFGACNVL